MNKPNEQIELDDRITDVLKTMSLPDLAIAKMYLHGFSLQEIAELNGTTKGNILKHLQKYGKIALWQTKYCIDGIEL